jgi:excisionase family DNA binding protein
MNETLQRQTFTVEEAAKVLGIGRNNAYALVRSGDIPTIRLGKRILVPVFALKRKLENVGE